MSFLRVDEVQTLQLDHTSRCNLLCPQCARTADGKTNPVLPMRDLGVQDYELILAPFKGRDITIFHCGNYGDVIASPTFDATLDYSLTQGFSRFSIATNASARKPDWWASLARRIGPRSTVTFAIDGMAETNGLYRVGSSFTKIEENLRAFVAAGGRARWNYIVFEHNLADLDAAKNLAEQIGVERFSVKSTSRFANTRGFIRVDGKVRPEPDNPNVSDFQAIVASYGSFDAYAEQTTITCKFKKQQTIYVDFDTRVWPCCWLGAPLYFHHENRQTTQIQQLLERYGDDFNRLDRHGWAVLAHPFFVSDLEQSWRVGFEDAFTPRLFTCGRTCGDRYEYSSGWGRNIRSL